MALNYCKLNCAHLIYISAYLYGIPKKLPINENHPIFPNNPYALSKHLSEKLCEFYSSYYNIAVTVIRPFNIFGPGQRSEFLIPKLIKQILDSNEVRAKDFSPKRDYIYIEDFVDALVKVLGISDNFQVINIGSGKSYSVREIIDIIQEEAETKLPVFSDQEVRENEIDNVCADIH